MPTLALIDGMSIAFRAFYALPIELATKTGQVTNAAFGFTRMLIKLMSEHQPDGMLVAWDVSRQNFRLEQYPEYKAQRTSAPDEFSSQLPLIKGLLTELGINQEGVEGFEADDLIATVAGHAAAAGWKVLVVTGDRDSFQLISPLVQVVYLRRGVTDTIMADPEWVQQRYGITPQQYVTYAALRGDTSDNLPGVPGVGEKRAATLLSEYHSLEGIYEHLADLPPKLSTNLEESHTQVFLNRELMKLREDVELEVDVESYRLQPWDQTSVRQLLNDLEFHSLNSDLAAVRPGGPEPDDTDRQELEVITVHSREEFPTELENVRLGLVPIRGGWMLSDGTERAVAVLGDAVPWLENHLFYADEPQVICHDSKPIVRGLLTHLPNQEPTGFYLDTALAAYVLSPDDRDYALSDIVLRYMHYELDKESEQLTGYSPPRPSRTPTRPQYTNTDSGQGAFSLTETTPDLAGDALSEDPDPSAEKPPDPEQLEIAAERAWVIRQLGEQLEKRLTEIDNWDLFRNIELPLVAVLARMEINGITVDQKYLEELGETFRQGIATHRAEIYQQAGEEFLINSTKELRRILFDKLELPGGKKTPAGHFSTDASVLEKLAEEYPIAAELVKYRRLEKLRSTYVDGYLPLIQSDGRIHTKFNQLVASTGRLSSEEPNLQNIPVRSEEGRTIRRAFIPSPGWELVVADYSQIELRVLAHLSEDPGLISAFNEAHADIHTATAARMFEVEVGEVTGEMRRRAKGINFGLIYGMGAFGVAQRLKIEREEAAVWVKTYFEQFPQVQDFMHRIVDEARTHGYTATLLGRRRYLPALTSDNPRIRDAEERKALNAPVQGSAADIIKLAMLEVDRRLSGQNARLLLQIHDELVIETPPDHREQIMEIVTEAMEGVIELRVPLTVEVATGTNLAECKS